MIQLKGFLIALLLASAALAVAEPVNATCATTLLGDVCADASYDPVQSKFDVCAGADAATYARASVYYDTSGNCPYFGAYVCVESYTPGGC